MTCTVTVCLLMPIWLLLNIAEQHLPTTAVPISFASNSMNGINTVKLEHVLHLNLQKKISNTVNNKMEILLNFYRNVGKTSLYSYMSNYNYIYKVVTFLSEILPSLSDSRTVGGVITFSMRVFTNLCQILMTDASFSF